MIALLVARIDNRTLSERELAALEQEEDFHLLEVTGHWLHISRALATVKPDVLLLDGRLVEHWTMPDLVGVCRCLPACKVLVICRGGDESFAAHCLQCGARGLCRLGDEPQELVKAIRGVHADDWWFSRRLLGHQFQALLAERDADAPSAVLHNGLTDADITDRERAIIHLVARGLTNKAIARELGISDKTVKAHLSHIFGKLHICHRIDLARLEMQ
jgi:two-component system nitrate/nitrite response regulator NarL